MSTQCKHNRAVFFKNQTCILLLDQSLAFLEKGRWRLPRWFFSCSTSIAVARPMIQTRRDLVLKHLNSQCTFQLTWNKNPKWYAYLSCIPAHPLPKPRHKAGSRRNTSPPSPHHTRTVLCLIQRIH